MLSIFYDLMRLQHKDCLQTTLKRFIEIIVLTLLVFEMVDLNVLYDLLIQLSHIIEEAYRRPCSITKEYKNMILECLFSTCSTS